MKTILKGIGMGSCCFIGGLIGSVFGYVLTQSGEIQNLIDEGFDDARKRDRNRKEPVTIGFTGSLHKEGIDY